MKASLKKKWVAALRSGKYEQTRGVLYSPEGKAHCCLGVLRHCVTGRNRYNAGHLASDELLTEAFLAEVGMTHGNQKALAGKNDEGWSFKRIANWIEKNL